MFSFAAWMFAPGPTSPSAITNESGYILSSSARSGIDPPTPLVFPDEP